MAIKVTRRKFFKFLAAVPVAVAGLTAAKKPIEPQFLQWESVKWKIVPLSTYDKIVDPPIFMTATEVRYRQEEAKKAMQGMARRSARDVDEQIFKALV